MTNLTLFDSYCRVRQARSVLYLWLDSISEDGREADLVASLITLLDGVAEALDKADSSLACHMAGSTSTENHGGGNA